METIINNRKAITGIILSGGRSLRMGTDKAFIRVEGIPIIERITDLFSKLFKETIIVTNRRQIYLHLRATICEDLFADGGVLGGLYTGLFYAYFPYSFITACDMPYLNADVIRYLTERMEGYDVVVPKTEDGLHPLHALYSKKCVRPIQSILQRKRTRITDFYPLVRVKIVEAREIVSFDPGMESFININTPEELNHFKERNKSA